MVNAPKNDRSKILPKSLGNRSFFRPKECGKLRILQLLKADKSQRSSIVIAIVQINKELNA